MRVIVWCIIFVSVTAHTAYERLTHEELLDQHMQLMLNHQKLQHELAQLKRLVFGSRHERFISTQPKEQLALTLDVPVIGQPAVVSTQTIEYTRTKTAPAKKEGNAVRMKLPADLPREQVLLEPSEDLSGFTPIGNEVTEELDYAPGHFFVRQFIRPKYARPQEEEGKPSVVIAPLPSRIIEKGIAGPGLLAQVMIDKYIDHLPLFRQGERSKRAGISIPVSTMSDWVGRGSKELEALYEAHRDLVLQSGYLEADETTIKVLDKDKKGKTHLGYYWVYRAPLENMVLFDYHPSRGREGPKGILSDYRGYLQTDGYEVYEQLFGNREDIILVGCMAHARRKFFEALSNDKTRAEYALARIHDLYAIERRAKEAGLTHQQRRELRQAEAVEILDELEKWMREQYATVLPQSPIGKAIAYSLKRWDKLCVYTTDGRLQIDNNLVENAIRPVALGRKNYLFAGSHQAAQRAAMIYSLLGTCKINNVNPFDWLRDVFEKLPTHPINRIHELLPHQWEKVHA